MFFLTNKQRRDFLNFFDVLQLIGGIILAIGYIPQIKQIIKTKSVQDINLKMFTMMFTGVGLMEIYAINLVVNGSGFAFLITNTIALLLALTIIILVMRYQPSKETHSI